MPRPHLLVSNTNICSLLTKWFDVYHRMWGVPHFILDVPFCYAEQTEADFAYIKALFSNLIRSIEELSGQRFDEAKAREAVRLSGEALLHWKRFTSLAAHRPSPITAFDSFVQMAPILTSRGTAQLAEHYRTLVAETEEQLAQGVYPVPDERKYSEEASFVRIEALLETIDALRGGNDLTDLSLFFRRSCGYG